MGLLDLLKKGFGYVLLSMGVSRPQPKAKPAPESKPETGPESKSESRPDPGLNP
jgi:hypothetical protein